MSFILDALRKSEHERQRAAMPGIAQVPFGLPRREMPPWALGVIALLVLVLLGLAGALWRSTWPDAARDRAASAPTRNEVPLALPAAVAPSSTPPPSEAPSASERVSTPAAESSVAVRPEAPIAARPEPRESQTATAVSPPPASSTAAASLEPPASSTAAPSFEPRARAPAASERPDRAATEPASGSEQTLPSAAALAAQGVNVPTLHLELHGYADRPADRFVFINGTKYAEGARLAEGPTLVAIAPNGAILSYLGHRFLLAPQ